MHIAAPQIFPHESGICPNWKQSQLVDETITLEWIGVPLKLKISGQITLHGVFIIMVHNKYLIVSI